MENALPRMSATELVRGTRQTFRAWLVFFAVVAASAGPSIAADAPTHTGHPRLVALAADIPALKQRLSGPRGDALIAQIRHLSAFEGFQRREGVKEAGHQAAGFAVLYALTGDTTAAAASRERVQRRILGFPLNSTLSPLERACRLIGIAMAYDLCWSGWTEQDRDAVGKGILSQAVQLLERLKVDRDLDDTHRAIGYGAAGIAALAVMGDPCASTNVQAMLDDCAAEVSRYLRNEITAKGIAIEGEGPKQMALMSGVLPFCLAYRNVFGRLPEGGERIEAALLATAVQTVPEVGTFRLGVGGTAADRSGLFSLGFLFALQDGPARAALLWLYQRMLPENDYDVTRPFQALCALSADAFSWRAAKTETDGLPRTISDADSGFHCFRGSWSGSNDVVVAIHTYGNKGAGRRHQAAGELHIVGMGGRWVTGPDAGGPHSLFAMTDMANVSGFPWLKRGSVVCVNGEVTVREEDSGVYTVAFAKTGTVDMARPSGDSNKTEDKERKPSASEPFRVTRNVLVDFSGACGAPALVVAADRVEAASDIPRLWSLHSDMPFRTIEQNLADTDTECIRAREELEVRLKERKIAQKEYREERQRIEYDFAVRIGKIRGYMRWNHDQKRLEFHKPSAPIAGSAFHSPFDVGTPGAASMRVSWFADPEKSVFMPLHNPPHWRVLTIENADVVFAAMTLQRGGAPDVRFAKNGSEVSSTIGGRVVKFDGARLTFAR